VNVSLSLEFIFVHNVITGYEQTSKNLQEFRLFAKGGLLYLSNAIIGCRRPVQDIPDMEVPFPSIQDIKLMGYKGWTLNIEERRVEKPSGYEMVDFSPADTGAFKSKMFDLIAGLYDSYDKDKQTFLEVPDIRQVTDSYIAFDIPKEGGDVRMCSTHTPRGLPMQQWASIGVVGDLPACNCGMVMLIPSAILKTMYVPNKIEVSLCTQQGLLRVKSCGMTFFLFTTQLPALPKVPKDLLVPSKKDTSEQPPEKLTSSSSSSATSSAVPNFEPNVNEENIPMEETQLSSSSSSSSSSPVEYSSPAADSNMEPGPVSPAPTSDNAIQAPVPEKLTPVSLYEKYMHDIAASELRLSSLLEKSAQASTAMSALVAEVKSALKETASDVKDARKLGKKVLKFSAGGDSEELPKLKEKFAELEKELAALKEKNGKLSAALKKFID